MPCFISHHHKPFATKLLPEPMWYLFISVGMYFLKVYWVECNRVSQELAISWSELTPSRLESWGEKARPPGPCLNIKTIFPGMEITMIKKKRSYLYNGDSYTGKTASLYWIDPLAATGGRQIQCRSIMIQAFSSKFNESSHNNRLLCFYNFWRLFQCKDHIPRCRISVIKAKQSLDYLIFIVGIPIMVRQSLCIPISQRFFL